MSSTKSPLDELRIERHPEKPGRSRAWLVAAGIVILVLIGAGFWWSTRSEAMEVQTAVAKAAMAGGDNQTVLNASGYVTARRRATVSSKVTGKVVEVLIEEGMKVTNGQIVARLDDSNVRASLDVAKAELKSAKAAVDETRAQLKDANDNYRRISNLATNDVVSRSELDKAEANAKALQAHLEWQESQVNVAEQQVELCQQQVDDTVIRAPFDGVVTTKDAQPGEMISPVSAGGGFTRTGIGTVVDMNSLEIEVDVNESYINRVRPGQPVIATLDAYPDWQIPCKVIAIIPTADRDKSTVKVRIGFDKLDPRILPEMSVKVAFQETAGSTSGHAVLVPKDAVQDRDGHDVVFIVQSGRAERRAVTVSDTQGNDSVVSAGISAGEKVVLNAPPTLKDGMAVREANL